MVVHVQTIVVFWVSTLGSSCLSDISQKCTSSILYVKKCGSQVDASTWAKGTLVLQEGWVECCPVKRYMKRKKRQALYQPTTRR